jgi:hypothetical protein
VRNLLLAAFGWVEPMPSVLALALETIYRAKGWNMNTGEHPNGYARAPSPTLRDLINAIPAVVKHLGWTGEAASTLRAGPTTRLESLLIGPRAQVLMGKGSTDLRALLSQPTIIEIEWFGSDEEKAFLLGALVLALAGLRKAAGPRAGLHHMLVIEEAHCLLGVAGARGAQDTAQPRQHAVREFCNLLAEIGGYGQGVMVIEQVPTKLPSDLLANTGLKIAHQLPLQQDAEAMGAAMKLSAAQRRCLPSLQRGEAIVFRAGDESAFRVQAPDHAGRLGFAALEVSHEQVRAHTLSTLQTMPL